MSPAGFDDHRHTVALPSADLSYVAVGDGPAALFVHGIATNAHIWDDVMSRLADTRRCIAVDLPLHGQSPVRPEQEMTIGAFADVLAEFCERVAPTTIDLVGHDTGGAIAQVLAARRPELLRTLTLIDCETQDNLPPAPMAPTVQLARGGQLAPAAPAILADPATSRAFFTSGYEDPGFLSDDQVRDFLAPLVGTPASAERFQELIARLDPTDLRVSEPALRDLHVPTLILWGTEDEFFPLKWAYWLQGTIPAAHEVVEITGGKLFCPHERAAELATHIRDHLAEAAVTRSPETEARRRDLVDGLSDALDEYDAGGADLSALVHDVDSVIVELSAISDPQWTGRLQRQSRRLAGLLRELRTPRAPTLSESQLERASAAVSELRRTLAESSPMA